MDLREVSKKRQKKRKETDLYKVKEDTAKPKFYILDMFPYPSGAWLHVGHPKGYIATDTLARKKMLEWYNVLHPMGFDTFWLWTENYAIEHKLKPQDVAKENIENYMKQLEMFGTTYDRSRSVNTADPKYFKRTQRVFLQMYNHYYDEQEKKAKSISELENKLRSGDISTLQHFNISTTPSEDELQKILNHERLAYVDYKPINRCPKCMTWLANEDLDDGKCERCWSVVEQKPMKQRVLRITKYAERLLEGLNSLKREESMKELERNWIGKSEGTDFTMKIVTDNYPTLNPSAPGHPLLNKFNSPCPLHGEGNRLPRVYTVGKNKLPSSNTMIVLARELRQKQTTAELLLREILRDKQVNALKFRRQHPLWNYIADFYCPEKNLVIELDDSIHNKAEQKKRDQERDAIMKQHNINVIRFTNDDIFEKVEEVIQTIIDISNQSPLATEWRGVGGEVTNPLEFSVYTTRIDTVFWMSFVAIAPEHPLVDKITTKECLKEVEKYKEAAKHKSQLERTELQKEKTWVFCWAYAINPFIERHNESSKDSESFHDVELIPPTLDASSSSETQKLKTSKAMRGNGEKVKIFVADYVLANYGTWVVMAVPAHDERDFEFAKKYNLPITEVIIKWPHPEPFSSKEKVWLPLPQNKKEFSLYQRMDKDIIQFTKELRKKQTPAEEFFRELVRNNTLWLKFRRQHPFGRYIVDFYCHELKLVIEIDWSIHDIEENKRRDKQREEDLKKEWLDILRFTNDELFDNPQKILEKIIKYKNKISPRLEREGEGVRSPASPDSAFTEKWLLVDSWEFTWLTSDEAITKMQAWLEKKWIGGVKVNYKMQDRVFSRQRYRWEPFPVLRTNEWWMMNDEWWNKIIPLDEKDLPLELPDVDNYEPTGTEEWPLANITDRVNVTKDGKKMKRETNTMPGRAGSSRYRLRYMDVNNDKALVGKDKEKYRGNVDVYVGGAEHVTRHMIYARFRQKFLYDIGVVTKQEPFEEYHYVGLIMGEDWRKMSKRRWNVVNPDEIINEFWTDALRTYEMFMWPFDQPIAWSTNGIKGVKKFLEKVIALKDKIGDGEESNETKIILNQSIKKLTDDIDAFRFNTGVSQLMILVNHLTDCTNVSRKTFEDLVVLVSPFAPHLAEELREQLGNDYSVFTKATRPKYDEKYLVADTITIGVQINGKVRGTINISKDAEEKEAFDLAKSDEKIKTRITGEPKKVIYVKWKILNIVV